MDSSDVAKWLEAYVEAWKSYDRAQIEALFSEDVRYRFHPYDEPVVGRDAVAEAWLGEGDHEGAPTRDEPDTYDARYEVTISETQTVIAEPGGAVDEVYDNCFVMRFDDAGRCREFTEWYVKRPGS